MTERTSFTGSVAGLLRLPAGQVSSETELSALSVDSFALVELLVRLQEEMQVRVFQEDLREVKTVGDLERVFAARRREQS
ncbi:MAG: acyl carrier protein [Acidobacteriota bacterium]